MKICPVGPKLFHVEEKMNLIVTFAILRRHLERGRENTFNQTHALIFTNNTKLKYPENMVDVFKDLFLNY
jgi:hypothetical protein